MIFRALITILFLSVAGLCGAQRLPNDESSQSSSVPSPVTLERGEIVIGRLILHGDPKYPKEAKKKKITGTVVLQATIEQNGGVSDLSVVSGDVTLADAAVDAVRDWKFDPYMQNGQPIKVQQNLTFNFVLGNKVAQLDPKFPPPSAVPQPSSSALSAPQTTREKAFRVGGEVTAPKPIYAPDPAYDKGARKAKYQGTCLLSVVVGADGQPHDIKVVRALGQGLDAKAVEAVAKWKFEPATRNGEPVAVLINVEVTFHLY